MTEREVPPEVRALLRGPITSHEELALVLFVRGNPSGKWTAADLAATLKLDLLDAREAAERVVATGLVARTRDEPPTYRFAPATPALGASVDLLARHYEDRPIDILRLMSSYSVSRVRLSVATSFADAFLVRRKKSDG